MPPAETDPPAESGAEGAGLPAGFAVGEYRIEALLGEGGLGAVYGAIQPVIGKRVAIKVLQRELSARPASWSQRFVAEARAVNQIRHRNIIDIFAFGQLPDGRQYFVMELLDGETARRDRASRAGRCRSTRRCRSCCRRRARARRRAREGHRPPRSQARERLRSRRRATGSSYLKLLDFGIAKLLEQRERGAARRDRRRRSARRYYMSPEQCRGRERRPPHRHLRVRRACSTRCCAAGCRSTAAASLAVVPQQVTASRRRRRRTGRCRPRWSG